MHDIRPARFVGCGPMAGRANPISVSLACIALALALPGRSSAAAGSSPSRGPATAAPRAFTENVVVDAGRGPVAVVVPSSYRAGVAMPLVLLLHGYNASGTIEEGYIQLAPVAEQRGFLYAHPDGSMNPSGSRYWNATDACCDFFQQGVDDSGYLLSLIQAIGAQLTVDAHRVYLVGHSNGAFMAYRMACDHPEAIAAIASLAGATWENSLDCLMRGAVHVLEIHGTN